MNKWHSNAKNFNYKEYFDALSNDAFFIGTDATERWTKKEFSTFCKPLFDKKKTWNFKTLERNIYSNKDQSVIWFNELVDSWMGICRGSGVIEVQNKQYKIKQYIISVTIPNDNIKEIIKIKKQNDSILISEKFNSSKM